jgi:hypothetical protein
VMASLEGELDRNRMRRVLSGALVDDYPIAETISVHAPCTDQRSDR